MCCSIPPGRARADGDHASRTGRPSRELCSLGQALRGALSAGLASGRQFIACIDRPFVSTEAVSAFVLFDAPVSNSQNFENRHRNCDGGREFEVSRCLSAPLLPCWSSRTRLHCVSSTCPT